MSWGIIRSLAAVLALGALTPAVRAFPDRPVKVIVPFAPGGGSDTLARLVVRHINEDALSPEPWVVVNVPGGGGTIGSRRAKNALPDGHTLLFLHDGIVTARYAGQATYGSDAFAPVATTGRIGTVICVAEDSPYDRLEDLLQSAAASPETITFAANIGAPSYFMARLVEHSHGEARFRYVQSGGGARRFADLLGHHVEASVFSVSEYLNFREGGLRALAHLGSERHEALPKVPTAAEAGIEVTYAILQGWWAPKGSPAGRVDALSGILAQVMEAPPFRERLDELRIAPVFLDSAETRRAFAERSREIAALDLDREPLRLPRLEIGFLAVALLGAGLAFAGGRRTARGATAVEAEAPLDGAASPRAHHTVPLLVAGLVAAYLLILQFTDGWFVGTSIALIAALTGIGTGGRAPLATAACAVGVPLLFQFVLHGLLGVDMP